MHYNTSSKNFKLIPSHHACFAPNNCPKHKQERFPMMPERAYTTKTHPCVGRFRQTVIASWKIFLCQQILLKQELKLSDPHVVIEGVKGKWNVPKYLTFAPPDCQPWSTLADIQEHASYWLPSNLWEWHWTSIFKRFTTCKY